MSDRINDQATLESRCEADGWTPTTAEVERIEALFGQPVMYGPAALSRGTLLRWAVGRSGPIVHIEAGMSVPVAMHCRWVEAETPELVKRAEEVRAARIASARNHPAFTLPALTPPRRAAKPTSEGVKGAGDVQVQIAPEERERIALPDSVMNAYKNIATNK